MSVAFTVAINPTTYISIHGVRNRWQDHTHDYQVDFLSLFHTDVESVALASETPVSYQQFFEVTKRGHSSNKHSHGTVSFRDHDENQLYLLRLMDEAKNKFCNRISKKMTQAIKDRLIVIKWKYSNGWITYTQKEQHAFFAMGKESQEKIDKNMSERSDPTPDPTPSTDSDEEPIYIPKHSLFIETNI